MVVPPSRRALGRRAFLTTTGVLVLGGGRLGLGMLAGCEDSTTGSRVVLETRVTSDLVPGVSFTNAKGWEVTLDRALAAVDSLAYVEGAPVASLGSSGGGEIDGLPATLRGALRLPAAHAHPGHYVEGAVLGEMTAPVVIDLLAGEVSLGESEGVTGTARSAHVVFADPASASLSAEMGDAVVFVSGVARKAGETDRPFYAEARAVDVLPTGEDLPVVAGCVLSDGAIAGDGVILMTVRATLWLDQIDFADVAEPAGGDAVELAFGEPPHNALARGIKKALAYHFRFIPAGG